MCTTNELATGWDGVAPGKRRQKQPNRTIETNSSAFVKHFYTFIDFTVSHDNQLLRCLNFSILDFFFVSYRLTANGLLFRLLTFACQSIRVQRKHRLRTTFIEFFSVFALSLCKRLKRHLHNAIIRTMSVGHGKIPFRMMNESDPFFILHPDRSRCLPFYDLTQFKYLTS